jgi:hypothetical protein
MPKITTDKYNLHTVVEKRQSFVNAIRRIKINMLTVHKTSLNRKSVISEKKLLNVRRV